jgi:hypothetical protein
MVGYFDILNACTDVVLGNVYHNNAASKAAPTGLLVIHSNNNSFNIQGILSFDILVAKPCQTESSHNIKRLIGVVISDVNKFAHLASISQVLDTLNISQ